MKSLHPILPSSVQVLEDIKWHFRSKGDSVTLRRPSASPSPWRRSVQGTESHCVGVSRAWHNTGHKPTSLLLPLPRAFLSLSLVASSLRLVPSHRSYLHLWESQGETHFFFKSIIPGLHRCKRQAGDRAGFESCFRGQPGGAWRGAGHARPERVGYGSGGRSERQKERCLTNLSCPASPRRHENLRLPLLQQTGELKNSHLFLLMTR